MPVDNENIEKLDVESLIVDLLACGLGATIILFFIFSTRLMQNFIKNNLDSYMGSTVDAPGNGYSSLIGDDLTIDKKARMGAIRVVEISNIDESSIKSLKNQWFSDPDGFWQTKGPIWNKDSLIYSIEKQIVVKKNSVSFVFMANGIGDLSFGIPRISALAGFRFEHKPLLRVYFVEGRSIKYDFRGTMTWPNGVGRELNQLCGLVINFNRAQAKQNTVYKLVDFTEQK